jgi:hypothetical protein
VKIRFTHPAETIACIKEALNKSPSCRTMPLSLAPRSAKLALQMTRLSDKASFVLQFRFVQSFLLIGRQLINNPLNAGQVTCYKARRKKKLVFNKKMEER